MLPKLPLNWSNYADAAAYKALIQALSVGPGSCARSTADVDQSIASGPSPVFSVSEREQLPAFALEEGAG